MPQITYIEQERLMRQVRLLARRTALGETTVSDLTGLEVIGLILDAPAADVVERKRGPQEGCKWCGDLANRPCHACKIKYDHYDCGEGHPRFQMIEYNFCPECGSDLRGELKE